MDGSTGGGGAVSAVPSPQLAAKVSVVSFQVQGQFSAPHAATLADAFDITVAAGEERVRMGQDASKAAPAEAAAVAASAGSPAKKAPLPSVPTWNPVILRYATDACPETITIEVAVKELKKRGKFNRLLHPGSPQGGKDAPGTLVLRPVGSFPVTIGPLFDTPPASFSYPSHRQELHTLYDSETGAPLAEIGIRVDALGIRSQAKAATPPPDAAPAATAAVPAALAAAAALPTAPAAAASEGSKDGPSSPAASGLPGRTERGLVSTSSATAGGARRGGAAPDYVVAGTAPATPATYTGSSGASVASAAGGGVGDDLRAARRKRWSVASSVIGTGAAGSSGGALTSPASAATKEASGGAGKADEAAPAAPPLLPSGSHPADVSPALTPDNPGPDNDLSGNAGLGGADGLRSVDLSGVGGAYMLAGVGGAGAGAAAVGAAGGAAAAGGAGALVPAGVIGPGGRVLLAPSTSSGAGAETSAWEMGPEGTWTDARVGTSALALKEGDWTVHVHIIEARDLKGENWNGTSDPVVSVEVKSAAAASLYAGASSGGLGNSLLSGARAVGSLLSAEAWENRHTRGSSLVQYTSIKKGTTSCVWDHHMSFQLPSLTKADVEAITATVSVLDANTIARNTLIGRFTFDCLDVYAQPQHEHYQRWVGLIDPLNPAEKGLQGYLRLSITVLGPGDAYPTRTAANAVAAVSRAAAAAAEGSPAGTTSTDGSGVTDLSLSNPAAAVGPAAIDQEADNIDVRTLLLLPPNVTYAVRWLVIDCYRAVHLPDMDSSAFRDGGIDAYLKVAFAGAKPVTTRIVSRSGSGDITCDFNDQLWVPYLSPCLSKRIEIAVYDYDYGKSDDRVGTVVLDLNAIPEASALTALPAQWYPIYGAPRGGRDAAQTDRMSRLPSEATRYRGSLLLSARVVDHTEITATNLASDGPRIPKVPALSQGKGVIGVPQALQESDHQRRQVILQAALKHASGPAPVAHAIHNCLALQARLVPPMSRYRVVAVVVAGEGLPFRSQQKLGVAVEVGHARGVTHTVLPVNRYAQWCKLIDYEIDLPDVGEDPAASPGIAALLPATFVYLFRGDPQGEEDNSYAASRMQRVSFARLDTAVLLSKPFGQSMPHWLNLKEDAAVNAVTDSDEAGSLLLRLACVRLAAPGDAAGAEATRRRTDDIIAGWMASLPGQMAVKPYQLRVHAFMGRSLPAADSDGSIDPYLQIQINGQSACTSFQRKTMTPEWYETVSLDVELPDLRFSPQVQLKLWDHDDYSPDDFVSELRYPLSSPYTVVSKADALFRAAPALHAAWRARTAPDASGSALAQAFVTPSVPWLPSPAAAQRALQASAQAAAAEAGAASPDAASPSTTLATAGTADDDLYLLPAPRWFKLTRLDSGSVNSMLAETLSHGEVLLLVELVERDPKFPRASLPPPPPLRPSTSLKYLEIIALGCRSLRSPRLMLISAPHVEFAVAGPAPSAKTSKPSGGVAQQADPAGGKAGGGKSGADAGTPNAKGGKSGSGGSGANGSGPPLIGDDPAASRGTLLRGLVRTAKSRIPSPLDPNFSERLFLPLYLPDDPLYCPALALSVVDNALGGLLRSVIGTGSLGLSAKMTEAARRRALKKTLNKAVTAVQVIGALTKDAPVGAAGTAAGAPSDSTAIVISGEAGAPGGASAGSSKGGAFAAAAGKALMLLRRGRQAKEVAAAEAASASAAPGSASAASDVDASEVTIVSEADAAAAEAVVDLTRHRLTTDAASASSNLLLRRMEWLQGRWEYTTSLENVLGASPFDLCRVMAGQRVGATSLLSLLRSGIRDTTHQIGLFKGIVRILEPDQVMARRFKGVMKQGPQVASAALSPTTSTHAALAALAAPGVPPPALLPGSAAGATGSEAAPAADDEATAAALTSTYGFGINGDTGDELEDLDARLRTQQYIVRLYVLDGANIAPKDANGESDPYLIVKLGDTVVSRRTHYCSATKFPEFFQAFEIPAVLPGTARLNIEVWDYDMITADDYIGSTVIDLEDRLFDANWGRLGAEDENRYGYRSKPIEVRELRSPTSSRPQGTIRLWVDILTRQQAADRPLIDISPPPPVPYELRTIIWRTEGIPDGDPVTAQSDLRVRCWLDDEPYQDTDIHWRAKAGVGSFNWRMKWDVRLPRRYARLYVQAWDQDIVKYSDYLGAGVLDLRADMDRAVQSPDRGWMVFRENRAALFADVEEEEDLSTAIDAVRVYAKKAQRAAQRGALIAITYSGYHLMKAVKWTLLLPLRLLFNFNPTTEERSARDSVMRLKNWLGVEASVHPRSAVWVPLAVKDKVSGDMVNAGRVLMSVEILPRSLAERYPAGHGRSSPNQFPKLPAPVGRLRCSMNPFYFLRELLGNKLCTYCGCFACCAIIVVVGMLVAPFAQTMQLWLAQTSTHTKTVVAVLLSLLFCSPPLYCYLRYVVFSGRDGRFGCCGVQIREEVDVGESASDLAPLMDGTPASVTIGVPVPEGVPMTAGSAAAGTGLQRDGAAGAGKEPQSGLGGLLEKLSAGANDRSGGSSSSRGGGGSSILASGLPTSKAGALLAASKAGLPVTSIVKAMVR